MSKLTRALAITLLAASVPATIVVAQQAEESGQKAVEQSESRHGPSPEMMARMEDGRIAMAKEALKLTPEQAPLWAPVEEKMRANYAERRKAHEERRAKRAERREARETRQKLALPERLEKRSERLTERAAKLKEFVAVLNPLYASLSDEQKEVADHVLKRAGAFGRGGRHHGRRWAMGDGMSHGMGHGMRHGMGHGMMGDEPDGDSKE
jgi:LTXXQ motif family protein